MGQAAGLSNGVREDNNHEFNQRMFCIFERTTNQ